LGIFSEQLEISDAIRLAGENDLSRIPPLGNMMGDVEHHDAGQSSHSKKNNRVDPLRRQPMASICFFVSQIGRKNW